MISRTSKASVAQQGRGIVARFGQSQDLEKIGRGSQWVALLLEVLVMLVGIKPVGTMGRAVVMGILRDVETIAGMVGVIIDAVRDKGIVGSI